MRDWRGFLKVQLELNGLCKVLTHAESNWISGIRLTPLDRIILNRITCLGLITRPSAGGEEGEVDGTFFCELEKEQKEKNDGCG